MGLMKDLVNVYKMTMMVAEDDYVRKKTNDTSRSFDDICKIGKRINKNGFGFYRITFDDLMELNKKYDLKWQEEEIINCMNSNEPYAALLDLPMSIKVHHDFFEELYDLWEENVNKKWEENKNKYKK